MGAGLEGQQQRGARSRRHPSPPVAAREPPPTPCPLPGLVQLPARLVGCPGFGGAPAGGGRAVGGRQWRVAWQENARPGWPIVRLRVQIVGRWSESESERQPSKRRCCRGAQRPRSAAPKRPRLALRSGGGGGGGGSSAAPPQCPPSPQLPEACVPQLLSAVQRAQRGIPVVQERGASDPRRWEGGGEGGPCSQAGGAAAHPRAGPATCRQAVGQRMCRAVAPRCWPPGARPRP